MALLGPVLSLSVTFNDEPKYIRPHCIIITTGKQLKTKRAKDLSGCTPLYERTVGTGLETYPVAVLVITGPTS